MSREKLQQGPFSVKLCRLKENASFGCFVLPIDIYSIDSDVGITWELVRNAEPQAIAQTYKSEPTFQ